MAVLVVLFLLAFASSLFAQGSYLDIMGIIRGDSLGAQFGKKVVSAGDVNGDTVPDFLVLAFGDQKVYLFHGKKGALDTLPHLAFANKIQLIGLGDLNNDGGLDFAMQPSAQASRLSIFFGGICLDTATDGFVIRDSYSGPFGINVSAGKLSDIGSSQIVVGYTQVGFDSTRFYFYNVAASSIDSLPFRTLTLEEREGAPVGPAYIIGDINSDGYADLAIGHTGQTGAFPGFVEIYLGGTIFDSIPDIILHPPPFINPSARPAFGEKVASVGDLNKDGFSDFVIGVSRLPLLYFGGNLLDTLPQFILDRIGDHFVDGGDINGDGFTDLLVGRDDYPITGSAYVYYGGNPMDSIVDLSIHELDLPFPADGFGQTVAGIGDIDGNGSNDFAVGSTSNTIPDRGYLWIFNGLLPSTGVNDERKNLPTDFELGQNYPNPFNSNTVISYTLKKRSAIRLEVFNIAGQLVKTLLDQQLSAGSHRVSWDGKDSLGKPVSSGVYLYKLKVGEEVLTRKMVFL